MGLLGEEHVSQDGSVMFTKTHDPGWRPGSWITHTTDRAIVITRNPLDALVSFFLLNNTGSHSLVSKDKISEAFPEDWDKWVRGVCRNYNQWHSYVVEKLA